MSDQKTGPVEGDTKAAATKAPTKAAGRKPPKAKRDTAAVDAAALYPLPPDDVDEANVEVLSETKRGDATVRVVTDGRGVWKEVAEA